MIISKGYVVRWFNVDWRNSSAMRRRTSPEIHDEILDALLSVENAKDANSGHSGFNVSVEDDPRSDEEIMAEIRQKVQAVERSAGIR